MKLLFFSFILFSFFGSSIEYSIDESAVPSKLDSALEVKLSSISPDIRSLPYRANQVHFVSYDLLNNGEVPIEIYSITLTRSGLGYDDDLEQMYLKIDEFRVSDRRDFRDNKSKLTFEESLSLDPGEIVTVDVYGQIRAFDIVDGETIPHFGNQFIIEIVDGNDIESNAVLIKGDFNK